MLEGDRQADRRDFEIKAEETVREIVAVLQDDPGTAGTLRGAGAADPRELRLLQREARSAARRDAHRPEIAVEHIVELAPAGAGRRAGVVDEEVIDLHRIVRVGEIVRAEDERIGGARDW